MTDCCARASVGTHRVAQRIAAQVSRHVRRWCIFVLSYDPDPSTARSGPPAAMPRRLPCTEVWSLKAFFIDEPLLERKRTGLRAPFLAYSSNRPTSIAGSSRRFRQQVVLHAAH